MFLDCVSLAQPQHFGADCDVDTSPESIDYAASQLYSLLVNSRNLPLVKPVPLYTASSFGPVPKEDFRAYVATGPRKGSKKRVRDEFHTPGVVASLESSADEGFSSSSESSAPQLDANRVVPSGIGAGIPASALHASRKQRRTRLPPAATRYLKNWIFEHADHPYPTEDEKAEFCNMTNLSLNQINNWFTNARRRILPSGPPSA